MSDFSDDLGMGDQVLDSGLTQSASHAKCIIDLSFTKFKWNMNEDFTRFHRPNIQLCYDQERSKKKIEMDNDM